MEYRNFGAIPSPKDVRDYRIVCASNATFPKRFELKMPEVKDQGLVGSCVAHAISTVIEYFSRIQDDNYSKMSVGYIYGNRTNSEHKAEGMVTSLALKSVCKYGDVPEGMFPYNFEVPDIIDRFEDAVDDLYDRGTPNRLSTYFSCYREEEIKTALMKNSPVIMAMKWYSDIYVDDLAVIRTAALDNDPSTTYHCMVIYGWDERGWLVQNSWGTGWGFNGRGILPYHIPIYEAYGVTDEISQNLRLKQLEASNNELNTNIIQLNYKINSLICDVEKLTSNKKVLEEQIVEKENAYRATLQEITDKLVQSENTVENQTIDINNLMASINELSANGDALMADIDALSTEKITLEVKLAEVTTALHNVTEQLAASQNMVEKQRAEIEKLSNTLIEIKRPYDSAVGQVLAKIFNFVLNLVNGGKPKNQVKA